jgi:hypothetical protein
MPSDTPERPFRRYTRQHLISRAREIDTETACQRIGLNEGQFVSEIFRAANEVGIADRLPSHDTVQNRAGQIVRLTAAAFEHGMLRDVEPGKPVSLTMMRQAALTGPQLNTFLFAANSEYLPPHLLGYPRSREHRGASQTPVEYEEIAQKNAGDLSAADFTLMGAFKTFGNNGLVEALILRTLANSTFNFAFAVKPDEQRQARMTREFSQLMTHGPDAMQRGEAFLREEKERQRLKSLSRPQRRGTADEPGQS